MSLGMWILLALGLMCDGGGQEMLAELIHGSSARMLSCEGSKSGG